MATSQSRSLSIIIPSYNGAKYLSTALDSLPSVEEGEETSYEVILVDDGSTDATLSIAESYQDRLPLRIVARPHNGNWIRNTILGMGMASGRFTCWLHQDDSWLPRRWDVVCQFISKASDTDVLIHPAEYMDASGRTVGRWRCPFPNRVGVEWRLAEAGSSELSRRINARICSELD